MSEQPVLTGDATKKSFDTLADYVERSTHWQEGGATRHDAKYALDVLSDSIEWTELGLAEWRDFGLKMAQQATELRAEVADQYAWLNGWSDAYGNLREERDRLRAEVAAQLEQMMRDVDRAEKAEADAGRMLELLRFVQLAIQDHDFDAGKLWEKIEVALKDGRVG